MSVAENPLDVWNVGSFDAALIALLENQVDLICDYVKTEVEISRSHDLKRGAERPLLRPANPHAHGFHNLEETIGREMQQRTIRAFHYTRLTDVEVAALKRVGIHLSTLSTLQRRFDDIVAAGALTRETAARLYAESPFHKQLDIRSGKFWMTSHPIAVDDSGVEPLMKHWGGEVASMWIEDEALLACLASLGLRRIVEVAVPMRVARDTHSYRAASAVVATFARSRGATPAKNDFDLCIEHSLPPTAVLAIHSEGERPFIEMGRGYPGSFVDVRIGYWNELSGTEN